MTNSINHFNVCVPTEYTDKTGTPKARYTKVGVAFINTRDDGDQIINIKLDFPVAVSELVCFTPKAKDDSQGPE